MDVTPQSKVIKLNFGLNETKIGVLSQTATGRQFNTSDTDAWLGFEFYDKDITNGTYKLAMHNLKDDSVFVHSGVPFSTNPFYYKLDSSADVSLNEIRHSGTWVCQLIITLENGDLTTKRFTFDIAKHILDEDGVVERTTLLEDYTGLIDAIEASRDELYSEVNNLESTYAPELFSVKQQLAEIANVIRKDQSSTDDSIVINNAIANGGTFLLDGHFIIKNPIRIKDNTTIKFTNDSSITLANGSNCYLFRNDDFVNGNKKIKIKNFKIYGNGLQQLRDLSFGAVDGYGGFGMMFYKVDDLQVTDGYVDQTNAWGIAHFGCNNFKFSNIEFMQNQSLLENSDGITGMSSNGLIENISGFTGDDMVAITSASGSLGGGTNGGQGGVVGIPDMPVANVVVRNIFPGKNGTVVTPVGVALYSRNNMELENITVENVKGYVRATLLHILNYWPTMSDGIYKNLKLNDLEILYDDLSFDTPIVKIGLGKYDTITMTNLRKTGLATHNKESVNIMQGAEIDTIIMDNIVHKNNHPSSASFCLLLTGQSKVNTIFASNCEIVGTDNDAVIYKVGPNTNLTTVYGVCLKSTGFAIDGYGTDINLAANAPNSTARISKITPVEGHTVIDKTKMLPVTYNYGYLDNVEVPLTLQSDWVNYGMDFKPAAIYKQGNRAYLSGLIKLGLKTDATVIGSFPVELSPAWYRIFPVATAAGTGNISIRNDGLIRVSTGGLPTNEFLSLDGISFEIGTSVT